jgi:hypothetical protein
MKKYARIRHSFIYHINNAATGKTKVMKAKARVVIPTKPVTITLTEDHVSRSIDLNGAGQTNLCPAALCAVAHAKSFPHKVEGHVDFQYSRVFIVSKVDAVGLPEECYVYEHNAGDLPKLDDTPGGQDELLALIHEKGPITITLTPYRQRSEPGRSGTERKKTGKREKKPKGAEARYAALQIGGFPRPTATVN